MLGHLPGQKGRKLLLLEEPLRASDKLQKSKALLTYPFLNVPSESSSLFVVQPCAMWVLCCEYGVRRRRAAPGSVALLCASPVLLSVLGSCCTAMARRLCAVPAAAAGIPDAFSLLYTLIW